MLEANLAKKKLNNYESSAEMYLLIKQSKADSC